MKEEIVCIFYVDWLKCVMNLYWFGAAEVIH